MKLLQDITITIDLTKMDKPTYDKIFNNLNDISITPINILTYEEGKDVLSKEAREYLGI